MALTRSRSERKMLSVLKGETISPPPIWMMRQAGRYLPEYRETRAKAGSFLDLCYNPDMAVEVTLQPIRRFGFDASIMFSDILVVPHALGRDLRFEEGRGPLMTPMAVDDVDKLDGSAFHVNLGAVYEVLGRLREELPKETTLIGFCGAPWTLATYMIAGHGTTDQAPARVFAYRHPEAMDRLLGELARWCGEYLVKQIDAGADCVQIFDSWAGVLDDAGFERFCVKPTRTIVDAVKAVHPDTPIIGFPRGAGQFYSDYRQSAGVDAIGCDWTVPVNAMRSLQAHGAVQGNLDPLRLVVGGRALDEGVDRILEGLSDGPHVFNLGHGITPETPIAHVEQMINRVRRS